VENYARVYDLVGIINIERGFASGKQIGHNSARPWPGVDLYVSLYDITTDQFAALEARERRLRVTMVQYRETGSRTGTGTARMFTQFSDREYRAERAIGDLWEEEVGQFYNGTCIYRTDILPIPNYLMRVRDAYASVSSEFKDHYLDTTYLGNATTTLREYIADVGEAFAFDTPDPREPLDDGTNCLADPFAETFFF